MTRPARPTPADLANLTRVRAAAARAPAVYPGPVGTVLRAELLAWCELGWRFGGEAIAVPAADTILRTPLPRKERP